MKTSASSLRGRGTDYAGPQDSYLATLEEIEETTIITSTSAVRGHLRGGGTRGRGGHAGANPPIEGRAGRGRGGAGRLPAGTGPGVSRIIPNAVLHP